MYPGGTLIAEQMVAGFAYSYNTVDYTLSGADRMSASVDTQAFEKICRWVEWKIFNFEIAWKIRSVSPHLVFYGF